jgi:hypothetical protein
MRSIAFISYKITFSKQVFQFFQDHKGKENGLPVIKLAVSGFLIEIAIQRESGFKNRWRYQSVLVALLLHWFDLVSLL